MSKKNLLNETQVRQFMKLAKLEPLASGFVQGLTETEELDELRTGRRGGVGPADGTHNLGRGRGQGEAADGTLYEEDEEADMHDMEDAEADLDHADALDDDAAEDMADIGPEAAPGDQMISVQDLMAALTSALEDVTGQSVEAEIDDAPVEDEMEMDAEIEVADSMEADTDMEMDDDEMLEEKAYTAKKEKPGADMRKGAEKRGAEATKLKHDEPGGRGHKKGDDAYVNEEQGADDREDEHLGMEDGKESGKKQSMKDRRKEMRGARRAAGEAGDPVPHQESLRATDELVEQITKRVAARILKTALKK